MAVAKHVTSSIPRRLPDSKSGFRMQNIYLCMLFILFCNTHTRHTGNGLYTLFFILLFSFHRNRICGRPWSCRTCRRRTAPFADTNFMHDCCVCVRVARSKPGNRPFNTERNAQPMIDPGTNCWTFFFILFTSASAFTSSIHTTHSCYNIEIYILYISVVAISFAYQKSGDNAVIAACTFRPSAEMHHRCRPATSAVMLKHVFFFLFHSLLVSVLFPPRSPPPPLVEHFFFLVVLCRPLHFIAIAENTFVFFLLFLFRVQFEFRVK